MESLRHCYVAAFFMKGLIEWAKHKCPISGYYSDRKIVNAIIIGTWSIEDNYVLSINMANVSFGCTSKNVTSHSHDK